jgi:putative transposase
VAGRNAPRSPTPPRPGRRTWSGGSSTRPGRTSCGYATPDTLAGVGALSSVGTVGDSYDNAMAESTIGQIKAEPIHRRGPWRTVEQLEYALLEYIDWWNHRRLHGEIGMRTPSEAEAAYYRPFDR